MMMQRKIAFILKGYPRLSETFIAQEILALQERGIDIIIYSLRFPTDEDRHPVHHLIKSKVVYLPEYLYKEPRRVWRAWLNIRRASSYKTVRSVFIGDLSRDKTVNRIRRFGQALVLAHELDKGIVHLHAHFLHTPASVARYTGLLRQLPWSCSAHARDIWTINAWEKQEKMADCKWLVTCTANNARHLKALADEPGKVELVYHGIDFNRFPEPERHESEKRSEKKTVVLLSVGRAVYKKGFDILLESLATLPPELHWQFVHIGGGPLLRQLQNSAKKILPGADIRWRGSTTQDEVLKAYRQADIFVLPCRIDKDGDRDGLPNVLMEAQSQKLVCVSTDVSGVPELIDNGKTGILVPTENSVALAEAIICLIRDPDYRQQLAISGFNRVRTSFSMERDIDNLYHRFSNLVARIAA